VGRVYNEGTYIIIHNNIDATHNVPLTIRALQKQRQHCALQLSTKAIQRVSVRAAGVVGVEAGVGDAPGAGALCVGVCVCECVCVCVSVCGGFGVGRGVVGLLDCWVVLCV